MTATAPQWEDCTSYSQGDKNRIPTTWAIQSGGVRVVVTNGHISRKGDWVMHCSALNMHANPLPTGITKEHAQQQALKIAKIYALHILYSIEEMQ
jgi:hypothetical protein